MSLIYASAFLFVGSFFFDAFYVDGDNPSAWSTPWAIVAVGCVTVFNGVCAWLANPLLVVSWFMALARQRYAALLISAAASLLAASFLSVETILTSEAPSSSRITGYGPAYWLWLASPAVLTLANSLPSAPRAAWI